MTSDILTLIQNGMVHFSKGQKLIANYIMNSYDKAAFMTASKLGKTVNVSESTVVRFAVELGYDGYPSMQKALQEMIRNKLTSVQRIEVANDRFGNQEILSMVLQSDIEKIRTTLDEVDKTAFQGAVDSILAAKNIYILGVRSSAAIATFLSFYFNLMFDNVKHIHTSSNAEMFEQMIRIDKDDVVIGISFPRYGNRPDRFPGGSHCPERHPYAYRHERHGVAGGFAGGAPQRGQRPDRGVQLPEGGGHFQDLRQSGGDLGRIRRI